MPRKGDKHSQKVKSTQPLFRWAGSKRKLIPRLATLIPEKFNRYIEPFVGSACLFFAIKPSNSVLGDINQDLIGTYHLIKKHPLKLARLVKSYPQTKVFYYKIRSKHPKDLSALEQAARFIFLNRFCFNGLFRTNMKGEFNVPYGTNTGSIPDEKEFLKISKILKNANFECRDFEDTLKFAKKGDFVYLDPPYVDSKRIDRNEYGNGSFSSTDIGRLIKALKKLDDKGITFLLSYASRAEFIKVLPKWNIKTICVNRHIAGFVKNRRIAREILVSNNLKLDHASKS